MKLALVRVAALVALAASAGPVGAAAPPLPPRPVPVQGAVARGAVLTAVRDVEGKVLVWTASLSKGGAQGSDPCALSNGLPARWSVAHGGFWVNNAYSSSGALTVNNATYTTGRW